MTRWIQECYRGMVRIHRTLRLRCDVIEVFGPGTHISVLSAWRRYQNSPSVGTSRSCIIPCGGRKGAGQTSQCEDNYVMVDLKHTTYGLARADWYLTFSFDEIDQMS